MESFIALKYTAADIKLGFLPGTMEQARNVASLLLGGIIGWLANPLIWFVFGPFRWLAFLKATALQESLYDADARVIIQNEDGVLIEESAGILMYNRLSSTLPQPIDSPAIITLPVGSLEDPELGDWRLSPFWSGFYAPRYYSAVLIRSPLWFLMAVPIWGIGIARWAWTNSTSERSVNQAVEGNAAWKKMMEQQWFFRGYASCRASWLLLVQVPAFLIARAGR